MKWSVYNSQGQVNRKTRPDLCTLELFKKGRKKAGRKEYRKRGREEEGKEEARRAGARWVERKDG